MADLRSTDILANERTYLAYVRTGLAFVGFGFVIARFALFMKEVGSLAHLHVSPSHLSAPFGAGMAGLGVVTVVYGAIRYRVVDTAIREGRTAALSPAVAIGFAIAVAIVGAVVGWSLLAT